MLRLAFALALLGGGNLAQAQDSPVAPGAHLTKLADGFTFTAGPACDARGDVFFTDQPNDRICEWHTDGTLSTFLSPCGRANGLCFDARGDLWACADGHNALWRISPQGKVTVVVRAYGGKRLNGPNDAWVAPGGGVYITDPYYARPYWKRGPAEQDAEGVYFLPPHGTALTRVVGDLQKPNGIIGTPDGKMLYVSDIAGGRTYAYDILPGGALGGKRQFCALGSDGMTLDSDGNAYLTGAGVTVFSPRGARIAHIPVPEGWTGNVCFGGKDRRTLFITATHGLYALAMRAHGVGSQ